MSEIRNIKLEILRPGPAHNQLISPLTPYLALCGADGPVTVNLPFEQRQLLVRLERLRYFIKDAKVAQSQREAELRELGETIGQMFGQVPALLSELGSARSDKKKLVHLRLSLSAFELGLIPFETAIAPDGFPGSGSPLFLQTNTPVTMTREVRRGRPLPVEWNRPPRILFIFASPDGLATVPAEKHLTALRRAIDPWVAVKDDQNEKLKEIKKLITILPEATLDQVRQACAKDEYTHVHILAHGATYDSAGDHRYGLALCSSTRPGEADIVDGERLAIALTMDRATACPGRSRPTLLSLATCDSANVKSVIIPGGSIAHELHAAGIPWVFASQFPLWMRASNIYTEVLYTRLLRGADPRCVLHELRQRLRTSCPETHDWASIVAYATVPWDFEKQVMAFRDEQTRKKIDIKFARLDDLLDDHKPDKQSGNKIKIEMETLSSAIRQELKEWREDPVAQSNSKERSERLGLSAASEKRIGIAYHTQQKDENKELTAQAYQNACEFYQKAVKSETTNYWAITQYLSMLAITSQTSEAGMSLLKDNYSNLWQSALQINQWQLPATKGIDRVWANATLAELELLGVIFGNAQYTKKNAKLEIIRCCKKIMEICTPDEFPVRSTVRQFLRYANKKIWYRKEWADLAQAALDSLGYTKPEMTQDQDQDSKDES
ncbi:MAG: CHAT domain-containing protein [Proteobacteria bacterium]|nr:CHAT domain-containing protein [Pseudomonadota bacterium]MBU1582323.1 CHAT domain-containing protein [Pseudomonadota bacterium]MBU2454167.1 CHAT domain-containing protein [Pseudomonadota bacterium]MBU2629460.1 CHAT domain-containing protein [Pseudomonadota bacterium]